MKSIKRGRVIFFSLPSVKSCAVHIHIHVCLSYIYTYVYFYLTVFIFIYFRLFSLVLMGFFLEVFAQNVCFICLIELMLNVQVNSYGHVGTLSPFHGTCTQN